MNSITVRGEPATALCAFIISGNVSGLYTNNNLQSDNLTDARGLTTLSRS